VSDADEKLGRELAELARQVLLWLEKNDLPGLAGLKPEQGDKTPRLDLVELYAGVYRRAEWLKAFPFKPKLPPGLARIAPEQQKRLVSLGLGGTHVLLVTHPESVASAPDGKRMRRNRIVAAKGRPQLTMTGALVTLDPELDSLRADEATLHSVLAFDFTTLNRRVDLGWDDQAEAARCRFKYPSMLDLEVPRVAWQVDLHALPIPAEVEPTSHNDYARQLARRTREFREKVEHLATYEPRLRVAEEGGEYYEKWKNNPAPLSPPRRHEPMQLTDDYLKACFDEPVLKKGDDYLMVVVGDSYSVFRLVWQEPPPRAASPMTFSVQQAFTIGEPPREEGSQKADFDYPVKAVVFRALDGGNEVSRYPQGKMEFSTAAPERFAVDHKAFVRWFYNKKELSIGNDEDWLDAFVDALFPDSSYPFDLGPVSIDLVNREALFLSALRASADGNGPIQEGARNLLAWCEAEPNRFILTRGMRFGDDAHHREIIGVSPSGDVYEWHPNSGIVTRMEVEKWLRDSAVGELSRDIYRNTAGMLPIINAVTWGGVVVMTGGVLGLGDLAVIGGRAVLSPLSHLGRMLGKQIVKQISKYLSKEAIKKLLPQLIAFGVELVMSFIPSKHPAYQFVYGIAEGFGSNAILDYIADIEHRVEKAAKKLKDIALEYITDGAYRYYMFYKDLYKATRFLLEAAKDLGIVLHDKRAGLIADMLSEIAAGLGVAFLVILFVVIYLDFALAHQTSSLDNWVEKQTKTLRKMVRDTGEELKGYVDGVRADIEALRSRGEPVSHRVIEAHDAKLVGIVKSKVEAAAHELAGLADVLVLLFEEMGIQSLGDLEKKSVTDLLAGGLKAFLAAAVDPVNAKRIGAMLGQIVSTMLLEHRIVPEGVRKPSHTFYGYSPADGTKAVLAGGKLRALWLSAIHPFKDLSGFPESLRRGLEERADSTLPASGLTKARHGDNVYANLVNDLVGDYEHLGRKMVALIDHTDFRQRFDTMVTSAAGDVLPPPLKALLESEDPRWPSDAILFVLFAWMRVGLGSFKEIMEKIEDSAPFDGKFKLATLLSALGLNAKLDAKTLATLKNGLTKVREAL
jgi:hypothetical protein